MSNAVAELRHTIARLRGPGGCPWDQEQTHASLTRCLIDECSELLDTIDRADMPHMREELGDVLIQVIFHAQLAEEAGRFTLEDVAREVNEKLIRRHPHVFGDHAKLGSAGEVIVKWEEIKAQEKAAKARAAGANEAEPEPEKLFKDLPPRLPALMYAEAIWKQIEKKKLPVGAAADSARIQALGAELTTAEAGRALFEITAACRVKGLDPEGALRRHADKVRHDVERHARAK
jgi:XTP/dITP diphosphohydrolase/tetrapyrrole methylase family protein/MazG family protein